MLSQGLFWKFIFEGDKHLRLENITDEEWHQIISEEAYRLHEEDRTRSDFDNWIMAEKNLLLQQPA